MGRARQFVLTTIERSRRHGIVSRGAEVAFFSVLSLPTTLLAILGGIGYVAGALGADTTERIRARILDVAGIFLTQNIINDILQPAVDSLLNEGRADIISVGLLLTLWSASRATNVLMSAVRMAHDLKETRRAWFRRLIAIGVTIVAMLAAILVLPLLIAGPRLGAAIGGPFGLAGVFREAWRILYWPVATLVGVALLTTFYRVSLPAKTFWVESLPGSAAAVVIWLGAGAGLRFYASAILGSGSPYAPLAAPVVLLLWLYVTSMAVIFGAEVNANSDKRDRTAPEVTPATKR